MVSRCILAGRRRIYSPHRMSSSCALVNRPRIVIPIVDSGLLLRALPPAATRRTRDAPIIRLFQSDAEYHLVADATLESLQDILEELIEVVRRDEDMEVMVAAGVMTLSLPPHGTWVINKQTPNRQLWWSSPISGPRRYEYEDGKWIYTREMDSDEEPSTLTETLAGEMKTLFDVDLRT